MLAMEAHSQESQLTVVAASIRTASRRFGIAGTNEPAMSKSARQKAERFLFSLLVARRDFLPGAVPYRERGCGKEVIIRNKAGTLLSNFERAEERVTAAESYFRGVIARHGRLTYLIGRARIEWNGNACWRLLTRCAPSPIHAEREIACRLSTAIIIYHMGEDDESRRCRATERPRVGCNGPRADCLRYILCTNSKWWRLPSAQSS